MYAISEYEAIVVLALALSSLLFVPCAAVYLAIGHGVESPRSTRRET